MFWFFCMLWSQRHWRNVSTEFSNENDVWYELRSIASEFSSNNCRKREAMPERPGFTGQALTFYEEIFFFSALPLKIFIPCVTYQPVTTHFCSICHELQVLDLTFLRLMTCQLDKHQTRNAQKEENISTPMSPVYVINSNLRPPGGGGQTAAGPVVWAVIIAIVQPPSFLTGSIFFLNCQKIQGKQGLVRVISNSQAPHQTTHGASTRLKPSAKTTTKPSAWASNEVHLHLPSLTDWCVLTQL